MEIVELGIEMDNDLVTKARGLALRYFGNDSDESLAQVLQVAFAMRCVWSRSLKQGQQETEEAVSKWEFGESPVTEENSGSVGNWLFRR